MDIPFYIGYRKQMAPAQARFLRPQVCVLLAAILLTAVALVALQRPLDSSRFEFGIVKSFVGIVSERPYPTLILTAPLADLAQAMHSRVFLVAPGKRGAQEIVAGLDGRQVRLEGSLIYRDRQVMIEVHPKRIHLEETAAAVAPTVAAVSLGTFTLRGEIVDSKCYFGVMKPGNLKPHKACAIRCISGGCTPVLVVRDAADTAAYILLVGADGRQVNHEVLGMVAEPLEITGEVERQENLLVLKAEPSAYRRLP